MNGKQWLETIGNLGTTIWEEAALPKTYWNQDEANYKSSCWRTFVKCANIHCLFHTL
jgi:hypothetical protein